MIGLMRDWLLGAAAAAMAGAVLLGVMPEGGVKKVGRFACGLILLLAVISPLVKLDDSELFNLFSNTEIPDTACVQTLTEENAELTAAIIEEKTGAYILDRAQELGIACRADVSAAPGEGGTILPVRVTITGDITAAQESELRALIARDLGITEENQTYERTAEK